MRRGCSAPTISMEDQEFARGKPGLLIWAHTGANTLPCLNLTRRQRFNYLETLSIRTGADPVQKWGRHLLRNGRASITIVSQRKARRACEEKLLHLAVYGFVV